MNFLHSALLVIVYRTLQMIWLVWCCWRFILPMIFDNISLLKCIHQPWMRACVWLHRNWCRIFAWSIVYSLAHFWCWLHWHAKVWLFYIVTNISLCKKLSLFLLLSLSLSKNHCQTPSNSNTHEINRKANGKLPTKLASNTWKRWNEMQIKYLTDGNNLVNWLFVCLIVCLVVWHHFRWCSHRLLCVVYRDAHSTQPERTGNQNYTHLKFLSMNLSFLLCAYGATRERKTPQIKWKMQTDNKTPNKLEEEAKEQK